MPSIRKLVDKKPSMAAPAVPTPSFGAARREGNSPRREVPHPYPAATFQLVPSGATVDTSTSSEGIGNSPGTGARMAIENLSPNTQVLALPELMSGYPNPVALPEQALANFRPSELPPLPPPGHPPATENYPNFVHFERPYPCNNGLNSIPR